MVRRILSKLLGDDADAESAGWTAKCPKCGHAQDLEDRGGIRYASRGRKRILRSCGSCGKRTMLTVSRSR